MRPFVLALVLFVAAGAAFAQTEPVALTGVHVVHVEDGRIERSRTVIFRDGRILSIQPESQALAAGPFRRVDARGLYLIPGLWDMHTHAHRAGRERWHYPMYIAHGVVGIRDASASRVGLIQALGRHEKS